jgi:hypothetical protein
MTFYALGFAAGIALVALSNVQCGTVTTPCVLVSVAAAVALLLLMNKLKGYIESAEGSVEQEIALSKAEVGDDLSFYYEGGG